MRTTSSPRSGSFSRGGAFGPSLSFCAFLIAFLFGVGLPAESLPRAGTTLSVTFTGGGMVRDGVFLPAFRYQGLSYDLFLGRDLFVAFEENADTADLRSAVDAAGGDWLGEIPRTRRIHRVRLPFPSVAAAVRFADLPGVRWVEADIYRPLRWKGYPPDDPFFPNQWHLENTGQTGIAGEDARVAAAWEYLIARGLEPGRGVKVGIIDDGFDLAHRDLAGAFLQGIDLFDDATVPMIGEDDLHGTAVTGVLAARWNNGIGVAGACPGCLVVPVRVSSDIINGVTEIDAFNYLLDRGVDLISNSWGPTDHGGPLDMSAPLKEIFEYAATEGRGGRGVTILFAAGNGNEDISGPLTLDGFAANPWVIAVGAINASGVKTLYSDWGRDLDIMAPSCDIDLEDYDDPFDMEKIRDGIWTTDNTGFDGYAAGDHTPGFCGTSSATPLAAGIIGLLLAADPDLTREEIYAIVTGTADKVSPGDARYDGEGFSLRYGYGRINALAAVTAACADGCDGAPPVEEEPIAPLEPEIDFVENMNTVTDDDIPLASPEPAGSNGSVTM